MMVEGRFGEDYFERGPASGLSLYENYRWIPELTIPMAMTIIDLLGINRKDQVLEIGCAKGYLVKALRLLHRQAWGIDISHYAIDNCDSEVKEYCCSCNEDHSSVYLRHLFPSRYNITIAKDVFEHISKVKLSDILCKLKSERLFVVVPLGNASGYYVPSYNLDKTHTICEDYPWWISFFELNGWATIDFSHRIPGLKDNYSSFHNGNGFFILKKL